MKRQGAVYGFKCLPGEGMTVLATVAVVPTHCSLFIARC
jgi:hypothetical protein